jgi:acyl carrier protein
LPPGRRKIGSVGIPYGFAVKLINAEGCELPPGQTGEIAVCGSSVTKGYYKNPEATAAVLDSDRWLRTGDLGYQDEDGYFFIVGRVKELIIKGGENIAPREIDEALGRHPEVVEAAAVGVPDPYLGEDIVAYVVLKPGLGCREQELLAFCGRELGDFKTPSKIYFVENLPKGPSGKIQRLKLVEQARKAVKSEISTIRAGSRIGDSEGPAPEGEFRISRTPVEEALTEIWAQVLGLERVGIHDNFFALGGHSLQATQVMARIRSALQVNLPLRTLFEMPTVARLAEAIIQTLAAKTDQTELDQLVTELEASAVEELQ